MNTERATKQSKSKEILGEGCGGLDVGQCLEIGRTAEDRLTYGRSITAAMSGKR